jgi:hypothetical protein
VIGDDENRLAGYTALPFSLNPYQAQVDPTEPAAAVVFPEAGDYDVVFDTPTGKKPGRFTFRYWVDDRTPPAVALGARTVTAAGGLRLSVTDSGSGVDPSSLQAVVDDKSRKLKYAGGVATVSLAGLAPGAHKLVFVASDVQESKNNENTGPALPNTTVLRASFRVRR